MSFLSCDSSGSGGGGGIQHLIEYVPGVGVYTDGVLDASSPNGPWTLTWANFFGTQDTALKPKLSGVTSGGSGGGGYNASISRAGGGGGAGGLHFTDMETAVLSTDVWSITIGAAGTAVAAFAAGIQGGAITITGFRGEAVNINGMQGTLTLPGGGGGSRGLAGAGGAGGGYGAQGVGLGGTTQASPTAGSVGSQVSALTGYPVMGAILTAFGGSGGGGASTTGSNVGANGGARMPASGGNILNNLYGTVSGNAAAGNTDGVTSYGGGGYGGYSLWGLAGAGGAGQAAGSDATGYGAGGGGGGGNAGSGAGSKGYLRVQFTSSI